MNDMANGMGQSQDTNSQPVVSSGTNESAQPAQSYNAPEERTFRQSEVNDIVQRAKHDVEARYKRMQTEQPQYLQQKYGETAIQQPISQPANNDAHYRQIAAEEAQRLRDDWIKDAQERTQAENAQRTVQNFWTKIAPGKEKYQDFDSVTGDIDLQRFPNVIQLLGDYVENSHDVLYALGSDRTKMANLEQLALLSPKDAIVAAKRLAQSIKDNEEATKVRQPNAPLTQMRPSNTGTDSGVKAVKDYRRDPRFRV